MERRQVLESETCLMHNKRVLDATKFAVAEGSGNRDWKDKNGVRSTPRAEILFLLLLMFKLTVTIVKRQDQS